MKKSPAIMIMCCTLALMIGLVACGGSNGSASSATSGSGASSSEGSASKQAAEAQAELEKGIAYWCGTATDGYSLEKAGDTFQEAADAGNAEGLYWLGVVEQYGTSADRWEQVIEYYQEAADNGCAKGYCGLGDLYRTGYGVGRNAAKAQELYQKAIDAGELYGNIGLGKLYAMGEGVEANGSKAVELYEKAAASDDFVTRNIAHCKLGAVYCEGAEGLKIDGEKALEYYRKAANENYFGGWEGLGSMYANSKGVDKDSDKAFEYYSKAAALGETYSLGTMYQAGEGCEQNYNEAVKLFSQEANGGRMAAYAMGGMAFQACTGDGIEQSYDIAVNWCHRAIDAAGPDDDKAVEYANYLLSWMADN